MIDNDAAQMDTNFLTNLERAGAFAILPRTAIYSDKKAVSLHLSALKAAGHAVSADEVVENGETNGDVRIFHALTCVACKRGVL